MTYDWRVGERSKRWVDGQVQDTVCTAECEDQPATSQMSYGNYWDGMAYGYPGYLEQLIPEIRPILRTYEKGHGQIKSAVKAAQN